MGTHSIIRHLKSLRQTLSQDRKPIGFFISAGCPLSVEMPISEWPLIPDMKKLSEYIQEKLKSPDPKKKSVYDKLLLEIDLMGKNKENIEDILSVTRLLREVAQGGGVVRGLSEDELNRLDVEICELIATKVRVDLPNKETPYHSLAKWISSIDREKPIEIFTTNYDLLMEQALEEIGIPYFDGFIGSRQSFFDLRTVEENLAPHHWTRLWKLHGSVNWFQNNNKEVFRSDSYKSDSGDTSYLIYPSHLKYDQSRKMPFLALADQLSRFLKQPSAALILCGYSFNDEHINDTIINAIKSNPTAIVIALMYDNIDNYHKGIELALKSHNIVFLAKNESIIGTNRGAWISSEKDKDDDLYKFVKCDPLDGQIDILLGDFRRFSCFLTYLIGHQEETHK